MYTGGKINAIREVLYTPELLKKQIADLTEIVQCKLKGMTAFDITQKLRGHHYFFNDLLLNSKLDLTEDIQDILNYFKLNVDLLILLLKEWPALYEDFNKSFLSYDLFLNDEKCALVRSSVELFDTFFKYIYTSAVNQDDIKSNRLLSFYGCNCQEMFSHRQIFSTTEPHIQFAAEDLNTLNNYSPPEENSQILDISQIIRITVFIIRKIFINYFLEAGGLEALDAILSQDQNACKYESCIPHHLLQLLLELVYYVVNAAKSETYLPILEKIEKFTKDRVSNITDKEIKEIDKYNLMRNIQMIQDLMLKNTNKYTSVEEVQDQFAFFELDIDYKMIKSPILEKKLYGIQELIKLTASVTRSAALSAMKDAPAAQAKKRLMPEDVCSWLIKNQVIEYLLSDYFHDEIIKRCHDLIIFMSNNKMFPINLIDVIWNAQKNQHESTIEAIQQMINEIVPSMDLDKLKKLYGILKQLPIKDYTDRTLELLFTISQSANRLICAADKSQSQAAPQSAEPQPPKELVPPFEKYYGFAEFWQLSLDNSPLSEQRTNLCTVNFRKLLTDISSDVDSLLNIMRMCLKLIESSQSSKYQSYFVCEYLVKQMKNSKDMYPILDKEISSQQNLVQVIIDDAVGFETFCQQKIKANAAQFSEMAQDQILNHIFEGKFSYQKSMQIKFMLLNLFLDVLRAQNKSLSIPQFEQLWTVFVRQKPVEISFLVRWLKQTINHPTLLLNPNVLVNDTLVEHIFKNILCNAEVTNYQTMSYEIFEIFLLFFFHVNQKAQNIQIIDNFKLKFVMNSMAYFGQDQVWEIFINSQNSQIITRLSAIIVDLYIRLSKANLQLLKSSCEALLDKCMSNLGKALQSSNDQLIEKFIQLLIALFDKYEGNIRIQKKRGHMNNYAYSVTCNLVQDNKVLKQEIKMDISHPIAALKQKISQQFNLMPKCFKVFVKNQEISSDDDEKTLTDLKYPQTIVIQNQPALIAGYEASHPRQFLTENQEYFNLLLNLLSREGGSEECHNNLWDLIMKLPQNKLLYNQILNMKENWEDIFKGSYHKLLYILQIIQEISAEGSQPDGIPDDQIQQQGEEIEIELEHHESLQKKWVHEFVEKQGLAHLIQLFTKFNFSVIKDFLSKSYLHTLLKILTKFVIQDQGAATDPNCPDNKQSRIIEQIFSEKDAKSVYEKLIEKSMEAISSIVQYSLVREEKDLENTSYEWQNYESQIQSQQYVNQQYQAPIPYPRFIDQEYQIVEHCFELIILSLGYDSKLCKKMFADKNLEMILSGGLLQTDNFQMKQCISNCMYNLYKRYQVSENFGDRNILYILLTQLFDLALKQTQMRLDQYFSLIAGLINQIPLNEQLEKKINIKKTIDKLIQIIKKRPLCEKTYQNDYDQIMAGVFSLLAEFFYTYPTVAQEYGQKQAFLREMFYYLFEIPAKTNENKQSGPLCKNRKTRGQGLEVINALVVQNQTNLKEVIEFILKIHQSPCEWRTNTNSDWMIQLKNKDKSQTGYVGIKNLGCICYMNSLLQQLYMIPSFREALLNCIDPQFLKLKQDENSLFQLKCMFMALSQSDKQYYNPRRFCNSYKDWEGKPMNVFEQMDVDEFYNMLMDRIENQIKGANKVNFIQSHFGGVISNEIISKDCPHYSEREEPFLAINLMVKNKKDVYQSFDGLIKGDILDGSNKYHCEKCDKKVTAHKRSCLKKLPNHLILVLKRFEFDLTTMQKNKINEYCSFPEKLSLEPYSQQGLMKELDSNSQNQEQKQSYEGIKYPPEYFEYQLTGIVIHSGIADSGHYYSYISDQSTSSANSKRQWYEFNDQYVREFNPDDIPSEAYGGEEKFYYRNVQQGGYQNIPREKIRNAYLLFYDRISKLSDEQLQQKQQSEQSNLKEEKMQEEVKQSDQNPEFQQIKVEEQKALLQFNSEIEDSNKQYHMYKLVFSMEYQQFIQKLMEKNYKSQPNKDVGLPFPYAYDFAKEPAVHNNFQLLKMYVVYFLTCDIRTQKKSMNYYGMELLNKEFITNIPICKWFITALSDQDLILELLLDNKLEFIRRILVSLVMSAFRNVWGVESKQNPNLLAWFDEAGVPLSLSVNFIHIVVRVASSLDITNSHRDYTEFFQIVYQIIKFDPRIQIYLARKQIIGRLLVQCFDTNNGIFKTEQSMKEFPIRVHQYNLLGKPTEEHKSIITIFDKVTQQKKLKQLQMSICPSKQYMYKAIFYLITNMEKDVAQLKYWVKINNEVYELNKFEIEKLRNIQPQLQTINEEKAFYNKMNQNSCINNKMSFRSIAGILKILCTEDWEHSQNLAKTIKEQFGRVKSCYFRMYWVIFKEFLSINDQFSEKRTEQMMSLFELNVMDNVKFIQEFELFEQFFIRLVQINPRVFEWSQTEHGEKLLNLFIQQAELKNQLKESFLKDQKFDGLRQQFALHGFVSPESLAESQDNCNVKNQIFMKLKDKVWPKPEQNMQEFDPDDDLSSAQVNLSQDSKVDIFIPIMRRYLPGDASQQIGQLLHISYILNNQNVFDILSFDSERLAPFQTMQKYYRDIQEIQPEAENIEGKIDLQQEETDDERNQQMESHESNQP